MTISTECGSLAVGSHSFKIGDTRQLLRLTSSIAIFVAFGGAIQQVLGDLRVAVVGCGGTGSAVVEQLARLGVRHFHLFDPDTLSASNVTRVYGSSIRDIGKPKVEVSAAQIARIAPDAEVLTTQAKITLEASARMLVESDVVFGCTDDNAGRLVLSRIGDIPTHSCHRLWGSPKQRSYGITRRH